MWSVQVHRVVPVPKNILYEVVSDVERYPEFLPWCSGARLLAEGDGKKEYQLTIKFHAFRISYKSEVRLQPNMIHVVSDKYPFRYLEGIWLILAHNECTDVDFSLNFSIASRLLDKAIGPVFQMAMRNIIDAFEDRAHKLYARRGEPTSDRVS